MLAFQVVGVSIDAFDLVFDSQAGFHLLICADSDVSPDERSIGKVLTGNLIRICANIH